MKDKRNSFGNTKGIRIWTSPNSNRIMLSIPKKNNYNAVYFLRIELEKNKIVNIERVKNTYSFMIYFSSEGDIKKILESIIDKFWDADRKNIIPIYCTDGIRRIPKMINNENNGHDNFGD